MGAGYTHSSTRLHWSATPDGDLERDTLFVTSEKRLGARLALQIGAGGTTGGEMESAGVRYRVGPGWAGFASLSVRLLDGAGAAPLVLGSVSVSGSSARTVRLSDETVGARLTAFDVRAGAVVGKTLFDVVTPYAAARIFGGPVAWEVGGRAQTGTDVYHYQLGAGVLAPLPPFDVYGEWVFFGERSFAAGLGISF